jgi:hypothetical protein
MKWIAVAILVFVVPYTFLTLRYRKPGEAYRPYEDARSRVNTGRLLTAGYQRITLDFARPTDPGRTGAAGSGAAASSPAPGGLPGDLTQALVDAPVLPVSIDTVTAAARAAATQPYLIQFTATLVDNRQQLFGAQLYRKGGELLVVPVAENLSGALTARNRDTTVLLTVPASALPPGLYQVTLAGSRTARRWGVQVH